MIKKLVFFNINMELGGVEKQLSYLINHLNQEKDYKVYLLLCNKTGSLLDDIPMDVETIDLGKSVSFLNKLIMIMQIYYFFKKIKPDYVISFHSRLHSIAVIACSMLRVKIICRFPGCVQSSKLSFLRQVYLFRSYKLIAISRGVLHSIIKTYPKISMQKILLIENGIDTKLITALSNNLVEKKDLWIAHSEQPIIMVVSRLIYNKRVDVLINAIQHLEVKVKMVIIGDGKERFALQELAKRLGINESVLFLGYKDNPSSYLKYATALVVTSEKGEGFPNVILEAKTLGVACIVADFFGGLEGIINNEVDGIIYEMNSSQDLARKIELLLSNNSLHRKIVEAGRQQVRVSHEMRINVEKYKKIFI